VPQRTRPLNPSAVALAALVWASSVLAAIAAPAVRLVRRTRRDESGQEAITIAVAVLFGILLIAFTYPLWRGVAEAVVDKVSDLVSDAA
jgi:hypothetical protein